MPVGYYYVSVQHTDLRRRHNTTLTYDVWLMEVTRKTIQKMAGHLHEKVVDREHVEDDVWIVPAPFCAMHYINDGK